MGALRAGGLGYFMRAVRGAVDGKEIHVEDLALDLLRWEGDRSRGSDQLGPQRKAVLELALDANDLRSVGSALHAAYEDYVREDEDFFARPHMEDVPKPVSPEVFLKAPLSLKKYLATDSFWRRKTGEALVKLANPFHTGQARWFVEGFQDARIEKSWLVLELTARGY